MTEKEKDAVWRLLFAIGFVCGDLACTISEDPEHRKWLAVTAKHTRDSLIEAKEAFLKEIGWDKK